MEGLAVWLGMFLFSYNLVAWRLRVKVLTWWLDREVGGVDEGGGMIEASSGDVPKS